MESLRNYGEGFYECNICYETPRDKTESIILQCCNRSKRICISCIHCLTTPICPYCRSKLPEDCLLYMSETNNISTSEPMLTTFTWEHFLEEENIINPFLYDDSRRLRRQIRRLRYEFQQWRSAYDPTFDVRPTRQERRRRRTNERQHLQQYSRNAMHEYNENGYNELFVMDDI